VTPLARGINNNFPRPPRGIGRLHPAAPFLSFVAFNPLQPLRPTSVLVLLLLLPALHGFAAQATTAAPATRTQSARPGPWGDLEFVRIVIEPPDEFMAADYTAAPPRWEFAGFDDTRLEQLWEQAGLPEAWRRQLRDPRKREVTAEAIVLHPDETLVAALSSAARTVIYNALAQSPGNPLQSEPFRFRAEMVDEWFENSGLPDDVVARIRRYLYPRGTALLFSDPVLLLPLLPTPADRVRLVKTLARKSTLLLQVRIRPDSDVDRIADYWSTGQRRKDVRPLLHSLARQPGGAAIDIGHLLPRFARSLLYTYPPPDLPRESSPDCHWTAMNFFNDQPDDGFLDLDYLRRKLETEYTPVTSTPVMGDILILGRANGDVVHSCVYLAADLVFTKNGQAPTVPWTLSTLADLLAFYPAQPPLTVRIFRRKW
jgi:hypothetical protein